MNTSCGGWLMIVLLAAAPGHAAESARSVLIEDVPHVVQKPDFCGEACAAMYLGKLGRQADQDYVFNESGVDPLRGRGCVTRELRTALTNIGFSVGQVWYRVAPDRADKELDGLWKQLYADLSAGVPSIVCMHYGPSEETSEHFRLVLGYESASDEVVYHEPAEPHGAYQRMHRRKLLSLWPLKYDAGQWTVVRMRLEPKTLKPYRAAEGFSPADYCQHVLAIKPKVPEGFTIRVERPFVVIGDESADVMHGRCKKTVRWAVEKLKAEYFSKDPRQILDIWLFQDDESYEKHAQELFRTKPDTPYGYYSEVDRALVMNISTGGGTLVHEIVHPFVAANFPGCPAWFNEGLGSLYEQAGEEDGKIHGYTNWRLPGLQKTIRAGRVSSFEKLLATTEREFYEEDKGTNYAQARYLCYYLQQQGLLNKFYHRFHAQRQRDPTGYATLCEVLGRKDLKEFQEEWEAFVLKLKFDRK
jgi:hypothetical protein